MNYTAKESGFEDIDLGKYFIFLKDELHYKALTLWCMYSMLSSRLSKKMGRSLKQWPRLVEQLKSCESGYQWKCA